MSRLLDRLQAQARDEIATKVARLARELDERIERDFPSTPTGVSGAGEVAEEVEALLQRLSTAEASARSSAKAALRSWVAGLKGELEEGALGMLDAVSQKNPAAFDGSLPADKEGLLFEKVAEGIRETLDQIIAKERREIEREIDSLRKRREP